MHVSCNMYTNVGTSRIVSFFGQVSLKVPALPRSLTCECVIRLHLYSKLSLDDMYAACKCLSLFSYFLLSPSWNVSPLLLRHLRPTTGRKAMSALDRVG